MGNNMTNGKLYDAGSGYKGHRGVEFRWGIFILAWNE